MASTLVVSLAGLSIANVEKLVTARGIDKVLVVDTPSAFAGSQALSRAAAAGKTLRAAKEDLSLEVAFATGVEQEQLIDSDLIGLSAFLDPESASYGGFETAPPEAGLAQQISVGISSGLIQTLSSLDIPNTSADRYSSVVQQLDVSKDADDEYSFTINSLNNSGNTVELDLNTARPVIGTANNLLTDLNGSVRVNLDVNEFRQLAEGSILDEVDPGYVDVDVLNPDNVSISQNSFDSVGDADVVSLTEIVELSSEGGATSSNIPINFQFNTKTPFLRDIDVTTETGFIPVDEDDINYLKELATQGIQLEDSDAVLYLSFAVDPSATGFIPFTAQQIKSLPDTGIASYLSKIVLKDNSDNILDVLPQLSEMQQRSIGCIQLESESTISMSAAEFALIDQISAYNSSLAWVPHYGIENIMGSDGSPAEITIESTLLELVESGIASAEGEIAGSIATDDYNLLDNVVSITIKSEPNSISNQIELSALQFANLSSDNRVQTESGINFFVVGSESEIRNLLVEAATPGSNIDLSRLHSLYEFQTIDLNALEAETILSSDIDFSTIGNLSFQMAESEISTLLVDVATSNSSIDLSLLNDLNNLQTVSLTVEDTETILNSELDLSKFGNLRFQIVDEVDNIYDLIHFIAESNRNSNAVDLSSLIGISNTELNGVLSIDYADYVALSTSAPIFNSLTNVELVVSGTASEIQDLFELDSELLDRVTFNITDGAEVKVSSALLDKLDGRINGAVIVSDDNAGLANVFDDAIPDNVKSFELVDSNGDSNDLDDSIITLTVNELGGLPGHVNSDVILKDTDDQLQRILRADLDYRVTRIELDQSAGNNNDSNSTLDLRIGQLERLLENGVDIAQNINIVLDPRDTLQTSVKTAKSLPSTFTGSLVIQDDGDALVDLFDGVWVIPQNATAVQLRSLDNSPLRLNISQLEQTLEGGNYPGFSGSIEIVDTQIAISQHLANSSDQTLDPRVVEVYVSDLDLSLDVDSQIDLNILNNLGTANASLVVNSETLDSLPSSGLFAPPKGIVVRDSSGDVAELLSRNSLDSRIVGVESLSGDLTLNVSQLNNFRTLISTSDVILQDSGAAISEYFTAGTDFSGIKSVGVTNGDTLQLSANAFANLSSLGSDSNYSVNVEIVDSQDAIASHFPSGQTLDDRIKSFQVNDLNLSIDVDSQIDLNILNHLGNADGMPLIVDAETFASLQNLQSFALPQGIVVRDSSGDLAEVLSNNSLDSRLIGVESLSGDLTLNVSQLNKFETLISNASVMLQDHADAISEYFTEGFPSLAIKAVGVSNGDRLSLSSDAFANLLSLESVVDARVYAGQIELAAGSSDVDFVPSQLADVRVSSLAVNGTDQLILNVNELERLASTFNGKVILEDSLDNIRDLLAHDLDGRVNGIRAINLDTTGVVELELNADQLSNVSSTLHSEVTVVENAAGISRLLSTPQNSAFKLLVPGNGLILTAEQFEHLGLANLVKSDGTSATVTVRDTADDLAGLIDVDPNRTLDSRIDALIPTNSNRLSLSIAQVNNLPTDLSISIVVSDSVDNVIGSLNTLDGRIQSFDLINGTEITLSATQFQGLQAAEETLGYSLLSGPFKIRGLTGEEPKLALILDDQDSRVSVVSSPYITSLTLTSSQLRELGTDFSGDVVLKDDAGGIVNELIRGLDSRVSAVETVGVAVLTLGARQLLNLPDDYQGKVILDDTLANIRAIITQPYSLPSDRTLELSIDQLAELTKESTDDSLITGDGALVVTNFRDAMPADVAVALQTLPSSFRSLEVVIKGDDNLLIETAKLGPLANDDRRSARDIKGDDTSPLTYGQDRLRIADQSSARISASVLDNKSLTQLLSGLGAINISNYAGEDFSSIASDLTVSLQIDTDQEVKSEKIGNFAINGNQISGVDSISYGSNSLSLTASDASILKEIFVESEEGISPQGSLTITAYTGQDLTKLQNRAGAINISANGVQSIIASALPARATVATDNKLLMSADDAVLLKDRLINANKTKTDASPGEIRIADFVDQNLVANNDSDFSRSNSNGLKVTVAISSSTASDFSQGVNLLADADEISIDDGSSLTVSQSQAIVLADRFQSTTNGSLRVEDYTGSDLREIPPETAKSLAITFAINSDQDFSSLGDNLSAFSVDADLLEVKADATVTLKSNQALEDKARFVGAGSLNIPDYSGEDLTVAGGFDQLNVKVNIEGAVNLSANANNFLEDVDVIELGGNDFLTLNATQANTLQERIAGLVKPSDQDAGKLFITAYNGEDLSNISDTSADNLFIKVQIAGDLVVTDRQILTYLEDADSIEVLQGGSLSLTSDQSVGLLAKLEGGGSLTINDYSTQDLSALAGSLDVTLKIAGDVTTTDAKLFVSNRDGSGNILNETKTGVDQLVLETDANLNFDQYSGVSIGRLITQRDDTNVVSVQVNDTIDLRDSNAIEFLADVDQLTINAELAVDNGTGNSQFNYVRSLLKNAHDAGKISEGGVLNIVNIDPTTDVVGLITDTQNAQGSSLLVDVTLKNGDSEGNNQVPFAERTEVLQNSRVRNIYIPQYAELQIPFAAAGFDINPPDLEEGTTPNFSLDADSYQFERFKAVDSSNPGIVSLDMSEYQTFGDELAIVSFKSPLANSSKVSIEINDVEVASFLASDQFDSLSLAEQQIAIKNGLSDSLANSENSANYTLKTGNNTTSDSIYVGLADSSASAPNVAVKVNGSAAAGFSTSSLRSQLQDAILSGLLVKQAEYNYKLALTIPQGVELPVTGADLAFFHMNVRGEGILNVSDFNNQDISQVSSDLAAINISVSDANVELTTIDHLPAQSANGGKVNFVVKENAGLKYLQSDESGLDSRELKLEAGARFAVNADQANLFSFAADNAFSNTSTVELVGYTAAESIGKLTTGSSQPQLHAVITAEASVGLQLGTTQLSTIGQLTVVDGAQLTLANGTDLGGTAINAISGSGKIIASATSFDGITVNTASTLLHNPGSDQHGTLELSDLRADHVLNNIHSDFTLNVDVTSENANVSTVDNFDGIQEVQTLVIAPKAATTYTLSDGAGKSIEVTTQSSSRADFIDLLVAKADELTGDQMLPFTISFHQDSDGVTVGLKLDYSAHAAVGTQSTLTEQGESSLTFITAVDGADPIASVTGFDFSSDRFATVDRFEITDASTEIGATAAELDGKTIVSDVAPVFNVQGYTSQDLQGLADSLNVRVTSSDAVGSSQSPLDLALISQVDLFTVPSSAAVYVQGALTSDAQQVLSEMSGGSFVVDGAITVAADDAVALGSKLAGSGTLNVNNYTNQDLTTANASTTTLNITTDVSASATLVAANLRAADQVSVIDSGSATINAADADALGGKLIGAGTLNVTGYTDQELQDINTSTVNVSITDVNAVSDSVKLGGNVDSIDVENFAALRLSADSAANLGSKLNGLGQLKISNYVDQDLKDIGTTHVNVSITASDALSNETKLSTADVITVEQDAILTLNAGHASQLGERLKTNFAGQGQVSITDYDGLTDSTTDLTNINTASIVVAATSNADISRPNFSNNLTSITIAAPEAGEYSTISASDADHFGSKLLGAGTLNVSNYVGENLQDIATTNVNVEVASAVATSSAALLSGNVKSVTVLADGQLAIDAAGAATLGATLKGVGTLAVNAYVDQDLSTIATETVNVSVAAANAISTAAKLSTADSVTIADGGDLELTVADSIQLGSKLKGEGEVSVTGYVGGLDSENNPLGDLTAIASKSISVAAEANAQLNQEYFGNNVSSITVAANTGDNASISATDAELLAARTGLTVGGPGVLRINNYLNEDLRTLAVNTINVIAKDGALLDSAKLTPANKIITTGDVAVTGDNLAALITVSTALTIEANSKLSVSAYKGSDISALDDQGGTIDVTTTADAEVELKSAFLVDANTITLAASATSDADSAAALASRLDLNSQTLSVGNYNNQDLSLITAGEGTLEIATASGGATLAKSNLLTADKITLTAAASIAGDDVAGSTGLANKIYVGDHTLNIIDYNGGDQGSINALNVNSESINQNVNYVVTGKYEVGDSVVMGINGETITYEVDSSVGDLNNVMTALRDLVVARVSSNSNSEFNKVDVSRHNRNIMFTAKEAGVAFTPTFTVNDRPVDDNQAIAKSAVTANTTGVAEVKTFALSGSFAVDDTITVQTDSGSLAAYTVKEGDDLAAITVGLVVALADDSVVSASSTAPGNLVLTAKAVGSESTATITTSGELTITATSTTSPVVAVKQEDKVTLSGTYQAGDTAKITIGTLEISHEVVAGAESLEAIATSLKSGFDAQSDSPVDVVVDAGVLTLTSKVAGQAFTSAVQAVDRTPDTSLTMTLVAEEANAIASTVNVTTAADSATVLLNSQLLKATSIVLGGEANASADNATALAARLNVNGKLLAVSDYVAQDLSAITNDSGSLVVTTSDTEKSTLGKAELSKVTQIKIGDGTASVSASDVHDLGAAKFVSNSNTDDANQIEVVDYIAGKNIAAIDDNLKVIVATSVSNTGSNTLDLDPLLLGSIDQLLLAGETSATAAEIKTLLDDSTAISTNTTVSSAGVLTITGVLSSSDVSAINDNVKLKVEVANGSDVTLDTAKLGLDNVGGNSDELIINGSLNATAAQLKELLDGGVTITGSGSVVIDNYTGQDISSLTNAGIKLTLDIDGTDISLTTANLGDLNNITAIQVAESTSVVLTSQLGASLATKFASENSTFGELKFSGYSNQDLAPIAHNFIVNVTSTSEGAVTLDPAKLNDVDKLAISASTNASLSTDADATDFTSLIDAGSLEVQSNGTLALSQANAKKLEAKLSGTGQVNVSAVDATVALNIADTLDVGVTLADNGANAYTINHTNLAKADRINVSGSDVFTVTSSDNSAVDLEQLKSLNLSSGADLKVEPGATSEIPNLQAITGTSEAGEEATFTTASDSASVNLSKISDIAGLDSFTIDANTNNTTLSLRLSETLSRSSSVAVNLDSTNNNRDFIYVETNMATAHAGDQAYDSSTTWASLGLGGLAINNFVPDKDTFGVVDSDDNIVLKNLATSFPSDGNFSSNGKPYLDIMDFRDLDNVEDIRKYIADKITRTDNNTDLGFAVLGTNGDNIDIGIFHAKWTGADGADPSETDSDLKVARLGVLSNVDADSTLSLTNAIKARFLFATTLPTGLES